MNYKQIVNMCPTIISGYVGISVALIGAMDTAVAYLKQFNIHLNLKLP